MGASRESPVRRTTGNKPFQVILEEQKNKRRASTSSAEAGTPSTQQSRRGYGYNPRPIMFAHFLLCGSFRRFRSPPRPTTPFLSGPTLPNYQINCQRGASSALASYHWKLANTRPAHILPRRSRHLQGAALNVRPLTVEVWYPPRTSRRAREHTE
jgi:hypothetical protein